MQILGMLTSWNFAELQKFQIDIPKIVYFTEQSLKWRQKLVGKIQNGLQNVN